MADFDLAPLADRARDPLDFVVVVKEGPPGTEEPGKIAISDFARPADITPPMGPTRAVAYTDFISANTDFAGSFAGTGGASSTAGNPDNTGVGWWTLNTGTTATGRAWAWSNNANLVNLSNGPARFRSRVRLPILSDASDTFTTRVGFINSISAESTNGVFFRYNHAVNGGRFEAVCRFAGLETAADTGITVAANTNYDLDVRVTAGVATFYINGVLVATISTNVPSGAANTGYGFFIFKAAGLNSRSMLMDYGLFEQTLSRN